MPLDISYRQPSADAVKKVSDFARKTGDYASLSAVDIRVLAVTYDLEVEMVGTSHLRSEPVIKKTTEFYHPKVDKEKINKSDAKLPGFFMGDGNESEVAQSLKKSESFDQFSYWREPLVDLGDLTLDDDLQITISKSKTEPDFANIIGEEVSEKELDSLNTYLLKRSFFCEHEVSRVDFAMQELLKEVIMNEEKHPNLARWSFNISSHKIMDYQEVDLSKVMKYVEKNKDIVLEKVFVSEDTDESSEDYQDNMSHYDRGYDLDSDQENDASGDDEDGWITPGNVKTKKAVYNGTEEGKAPQKVMVACMTTDFAMQNVCKLLGLNIIGTNGMMIKDTKTWILRCYGCFKTTPLMDRKFCPKCGNKTLKRVSVTLNKDGSQQVHISTRRQLTSKGKKFSLPAPKGGKHAVNPRLVEDQREAQQRLSKKALLAMKAPEEHVPGSSPFSVKDTTSRAAMLGLQGQGKGNAEVPGLYWDQRNPNAVRKSTGNRRRKKT